MSVHGEGDVMVPAHLNFGKFLLDRLRKANPDDMCLCWSETGDKITYGSFVQHAVSVSASLSALGVARGDTVAVAGEPRVTHTPTALAVLLAGAAYTSIDLHCGRAILTHKLNLTKPKYIICTSQFWEAYSDILRGLEYIKTIISFDDIEGIELSVARMATRQVDAATFEPAAVRGEVDVAIIGYSSGTTGLSKGVLLTHLNCIARISIDWCHAFESLLTCYIIGEMDATYTIFVMCLFIVAGKRVVYTSRCLELKTVQEYKVNIITTIPKGVQDILDKGTEEYDLSSVKIIYSAADYLQPTIQKAFKERYPDIQLRQLYGTTEIDIVTSQIFLHGDVSTSVGSVIPGCTLKVVDPETREILGSDRRGEICARTPCLMKGYLGADSEPLDDEGFYLTGDIGYYDHQKEFHVVDRLKNIICYDGYNVIPVEVEMVLLRHPAVREAAVVGKPAGALGELATAFVVLQPGARVTEAELVGYVEKEVTWYMGLHGGVRFVPEIPRNARRKILRRRLREMLEREESGVTEIQQ